MIRKLVTGTALLGLGAYLWMGTSLGSYARTAYAQVRGFIDGAVPIDFEIQRARKMSEDLVPEIHSAKRTILNEEVRLARLHREIEQMTKNLDGEKVALLSLRQQLAQNLTSYKIGSENYSRQAVENELNRRFNSFRHADEVLKVKREIVASRETALRAAKEKHDKLLEGKQQLEAELAALEARHKLLEVKKMACTLTVDDSQLAQVRGLMASINDRLAVEAKLAEEDGQLMKEIATEDIPPADLGKRIDQYFAPEASDVPTGGTPL